MSDEPGVLIKDVAESLCIHPFMLSRWRKEVRDGAWLALYPNWTTRALPSSSGFVTSSVNTSFCSRSMTC